MLHSYAITHLRFVLKRHRKFMRQTLPRHFIRVGRLSTSSTCLDMRRHGADLLCMQFTALSLRNFSRVERALGRDNPPSYVGTAFARPLTTRGAVVALLRNVPGDLIKDES